MPKGKVCPLFAFYMVKVKCVEVEEEQIVSRERFALSFSVSNWC